MQDSPNPKGVMSSKASGEPSLLLSTSVLYAIRHAVVAARTSLGISATRGKTPKAATLDSTGVSKAVTNGKGHIFFVLSAPATTVKIKEVGAVKHVFWWFSPFRNQHLLVLMYCLLILSKEIT